MAHLLWALATARFSLYLSLSKRQNSSDPKGGRLVRTIVHKKIICIEKRINHLVFLKLSVKSTKLLAI